MAEYDITQFPAKGFRSLPQLVLDHAASHPDGVAMRQKDFGIWQETTWQGLAELTRAIAAGLMDLGMKAGDHIGILSENRQEWVQAQLAAMAAGGVVVGMYPTSPAPEIDHLVNASDTTILFVEDQEQLDKILELDGRIPLMRQLIIFDPKGTQGCEDYNLISFAQLVRRGRAALNALAGEVDTRLKAIQPDDTGLMVFTSGSTGLPKAAEITHNNLWAAACYTIQNFVGFKPGTNVLSYLPLCHIAEQNVTVINALTGQFTMNFGESLRTVQMDLREVAPEIFFGVPRIWERMQSGIMVQTATTGKIRRALTMMALDSAKPRGAKRPGDWTLKDKIAHRFWSLLIYRHILAYLGLNRTRVALSAAAPIAEDLLHFLRGLGLNIREVWGMSETTGVGSVQPDFGDCDGRVGLFSQGIQYRIAEDGELLVKGDIIFKGYYKNPEASAETLVDGWLLTGDVAQAEPDGSISIVDRKKDIMINAAGKNLTPSLIENTMKSSPFIKECIVIADRRPYVTALVQLDLDTMRIWAEQNGVSYTTYRSLAENRQVAEMIDTEIAAGNAKLARVEQIKKVYLLPKELDHDDGEVTATLKVRRNKIYEYYENEINALYGT
jgi:long-chain acyl-CoA synthetase